MKIPKTVIVILGVIIVVNVFIFTFFTYYTLLNQAKSNL